MPIPVICPSCKAQFRVSDKFAGQTGPCPKCKAKISIPKLAPEIKIAEPEPIGPKDAKGRSVSKPIPRFEPVVTTRSMGLSVAAAFATLIVAWIAGKVMIERQHLLAAIGTPLVALPLVLAGYQFLKEEEAEGYHGRALWVRGAICAAIYSLLWGVFYFVPDYWIVEYWSWIYISAPFLILGTLTSFACFDLEFGNGFFHYCFFLVGTLLLRSLIGLPALWNMVGT